MDATLQQILNFLITLQAERNALVDEVTKLRVQVAEQNGHPPRGPDAVMPITGRETPEYRASVEAYYKEQATLDRLEATERT